jgi:hypothetical protein
MSKRIVVRAPERVWRSVGQAIKVEVADFLTARRD